MKKILIAAVFLACLGGNAMADDGVTPVILGSKSGTEWTMAVGLNNATDYVAFQMDIQLPEGVSIDGSITATTRLKDGGTVDLGTDGSKSTNFILDYNQVDATNNIYRVIGYNLGNHSIVASDNLNDCILQIPLKSETKVEYTTMTTSVSNIAFVNTDLAEVALADVTEASPALYGDVNNDGQYNSADILGVIDLMLEKDNDQLNKYAADPNNDGQYNSADVLGIIENMLNN